MRSTYPYKTGLDFEFISKSAGCKVSSSTKAYCIYKCNRLLEDKFIYRVEAIRSCARMVLCINNREANNILVKNKPKLTPLGQTVFIGKWNPPNANQCYQCWSRGHCGLQHPVANKYEVKPPV